MTLFGFPNPVNEVAARVVAGGVVLQCVVTLVLTVTFGTGWLWLTAVLAFGFVARVSGGPRFSPLGQFATRVAAPRIGHAKLVAGPPKRFAQGMGAALSLAAVVVHFGFGLHVAAAVLVAMILVAATLESVLALCLGCHVFAVLMRLGVVPEETCVACANVALRASGQGAAAH